MSRRLPGSRDGLWQRTPHGVEPDRARDNPRRQRCPACGADIGNACRSAGREMRTYHPTRQGSSDQ